MRVGLRPRIPSILFIKFEPAGSYSDYSFQKKKTETVGLLLL